MKRILLIAMVACCSCNQAAKFSNKLYNTVGWETPKSVKIGDTVMVSVIGHGMERGVLMAYCQENYYIIFDNRGLSSWYDDYNKILPYKTEWDSIINKYPNQKP